MPGFGRGDINNWLRLSLIADPEFNYYATVQRLRASGRYPSSAEADAAARRIAAKSGKGIDHVSDEIQAMVDCFGTHQLVNLRGTTSNGAAGGADVVGPATANGRVTLVCAAQVTHNDGVNRTLGLALLVLPSLTQVGLVPTVSVGGGNPVCLQRPVVVPAGAVIQGVSFDGMGVAAVMSLRLASIDLPLGEYVKLP